ncbi:MAG: hypothetical protein IT503_18475 [Burkholderiaceae bacterium]|nr:hypothetical protein [Ideonella sp.]MCC7288164.1 hypothetical protein [Burkholderiaceae bacterium]
MHDDRVFEASHRVEAGLRAFDGHFPDAPVLPGAYLLAIVLQQIEQQPALRERLRAPWRVQQVKFLAPVGPGQTLLIGLHAQRDAIAFSVHHGSTLVARGQVDGGTAQ